VLLKQANGHGNSVQPLPNHLGSLLLYPASRPLLSQITHITAAAAAAAAALI